MFCHADYGNSTDTEQSASPKALELKYRGKPVNIFDGPYDGRLEDTRIPNY